MTPISTSPLAAFAEERLALAAPTRRVAAERLVAALLDAALAGQGGPVRRKPVISADGTPLSFSLQEDGRAERPAFRLLVEPGLPSLTVAEQIALSLETVDGLLGALGWRSLASSIDAVSQSLFPPSAEQLEGWWGGMGLGCAVVADDLELRVYFNLRNGSVTSRWQRFGEALCALPGVAVERAAFEGLIERAAPFGVPAGVALSLHNGRLRGVRLYLPLHAPSAAAICAIAKAAEPGPVRTVEALCDDYEARVRPFSYECVTVAFDFVVRPGGVCDLTPVRVKADFDCTTLNDGRPAAERLDWLACQHRAAGLPRARLDAFLGALRHQFGDCRVDYLSLGLRGGVAELTTYVIPPAGCCSPV